MNKRQIEAKRNGVPEECICPLCFNLMKPIYENNGFQAPDPEKVELVGYECKSCGGKSVR